MTDKYSVEATEKLDNEALQLPISGAVPICEQLLATFPTTVDVPGLSNTLYVVSGDTSEALSQALQEKVAAILLLSQQEERYILESTATAALQKKTEELQRNLLQVQCCCKVCYYYSWYCFP